MSQESRSNTESLSREYERRARERPWTVYPTRVLRALEPFHNSFAEVRTAWGPNRGGKTTAGAFEAVSYATGHNLIRNEDYDTPNQVWGVCIDYQSTPGRVMIDKVRQMCPSGTKYYKQSHIFRLPNRSEIHIKSQAEGREHFYGGEPRAVWLDEGKAGEIGLENFNEIYARRSPYHPLSIFITLTHLNGHDWLYHRLLNPDSKEFIKGAHVTKFTIADTLKENGGFWSKEQVEAMEGAYDELERQARFYGDAMPFGNRPFFDWRRLMAAGHTAVYGVEAEPKMLSLSHAKMEELADARGRLFRPRESGHSYIASWDPSSGSGQDRSAFVVFDRGDLAEVFHSCRADLDPELFAREIVLPASFYYGQALLCIESNGESGGAAVGACREYPNLYMAKDWQKRTATFTEKIGWQTTEQSRSRILDALTRALREGKWSPSKQLLEEMSRVIIKKRDNGRYRAEHADGFHDDLVMASGIALAVHYEEPVYDFPDFRKLKVRYGPKYTVQEYAI